MFRLHDYVTLPATFAEAENRAAEPRLPGEPSRDNETPDYLRENMGTLRAHMQRVPPCHFTLNNFVPPDYGSLLHSLAGKSPNENIHIGHVLMAPSRSGERLRALLCGPGDYLGRYDGDTINISVRPESLPAAWGTISDLLFSPGNPFKEWEVTNLGHSNLRRDDRIVRGMQITLRACPLIDERAYTAFELADMRTFINRCESALRWHDIPRGELPTSDVQANEWWYTSYRNEHRSGTGSCPQQRRALLSEPFYQLISQPAR